ncbi:hypothetical protein [Thermacetogenium phaeum]|uniref:hypothetical protein n=1 Tax=Thermacetogenium phaeum TaxID=85874 RepID=UPI0012DBD6DC|nr:hypothetical protein [Thermacetogenium phaeum]
MVATAYQAEGRRLGLLWLAAVSPVQLALGKFLAYLPLALFAAGTAGVMIIVLGLQKASALLMIIFAFTGAAAGIALSLVPASLSMNAGDYRGGSITDMAFEQVPTKFWSICSTIILGGLMATFGIVILVNSEEIISPVAFWTGSIAGSVLIIAAMATTVFLLKRRFWL